MRRLYLPVLLLSAAAALFYLPGLLPGRVLLPLDILCGVQPWSVMPVCHGRTVANPVLSDQVFAFYPWHEIQKRDGWRGALWNPYAFAGSPLLGNGQSAALYPPNWLNWILSASWSYVLLAIFHTAIAAISMRAFARRHVSEAAAMLAAISYAFTYNFVFSVGYPFGWSMAWIPSLLWAVDSRRWILAAVFTALIMLAGHPETAIVAAFIVGAWFLSRRPNRADIVYAAAAASAGTVLALPQIIPLLRYVLPSAASHFRDQLFPVIYSAHTMIEFLTPAFFGTSAPAHRWGSNDGNFFGLASFLLVIAFMIGRPREAMRNPWTWIFLVSLAFVYGVPPFSWLLNLPHLHIVYSNRFWVSATFAGAMLAAHGLDEFINKRIPRLVSLYLLPAAFCFLMLFALWHFRAFIQALNLSGFETRVVLKFIASLIVTVAVLRWRPTWTAVVVYGECILYLALYNTAAPKELLFPKPPVVDFLKKDTERFRIMGDGVFPANTASVYGLEDLRGYDAITPMPWFRAMEQMDPTFPDLLVRTDLAPVGIHMDTLFQRDHVYRMLDKWGEGFRELLRHVFYWNERLTRVDRPDLLNELNVKYYLVPHVGSLPPGLDDWQREYSAEVDVYRNPHVYPRAYVLRPGEQTPAAAQISEYLPDQVTVRAEGPGTLVLADAWDPGWHAEGYSIAPYQGFFRSVPLNPGSQTVRFRYRPW